MKATLHRRDVVGFLLKDRRDLLVVAGLGSTAWDITAAGDHDLSFPLWGAMGQAAMMGLGLALAAAAAIALRAHLRPRAHSRSRSRSESARCPPR